MKSESAWRPYHALVSLLTMSGVVAAQPDEVAPLVVDVRVQAAEVLVGEPIVLHVTVTNQSQERIPVFYRGGARATKGGDGGTAGFGRWRRVRAVEPRFVRHVPSYVSKATRAWESL